MNFKLKSGVTKQDLVGTKWDQSEWDTNKKEFWQKEMFKLGFGWDSGDGVQLLDKEYFKLWSGYGISYHSLEYNSHLKNETFTWEDIFEEITPEQCDTSSQEALSEELNTKEYKYTLKEFKYAWEALKHFTEQGGLYYLACKGEYSLCMNDQDVLTLHRTGRVYIKEELPWWETVSEDKPCWVWFDNSLHIVNRFKEQFLVTTLNKYLDPVECLPLTKEQVQDIVSTQEKWHD